MRSLYEAARIYARLGYVCIPCDVYLDSQGNKQARFPDGGYKSRLFDNPSDWKGFDGLAINTAMSGIVVVDIDCGDGKDGFAGLEAAGIELPETPMQATTQSGGRHLVYRATTIPVEQSSGKLAEHVDIRGDASGILYAYPTKVAGGGGEYTWDGPAVAVADLPEFPVELARRLAVVRKHRRTPPSDFTPSDVTAAQREWALQKIGYKLKDIAGSVDGQRNDTLGRAVPRIVGLVKTIGEDLDTFTEKISAAYAESGGQDEEQVQSWITSSLSYVQPEDPSTWLPQDRERSFWDERPELAQIRQAASAGLASPWAVLGALVVRVLADVPYSYRIDTGIGSPLGGNLNLFSVLAAKSGGGKGIASSVSQYLWDTDVLCTEVASGEALAKLFVARRKDDDGLYHDVWVRRSVIVDASEFGSVKASSERSGSTLMQRLCAAFSGESLAFAVSDESKNISVPSNSYRLGLVTGVQYANAGLLLSEASVATGQAQRFLWFPANISADELPKDRQPWPAPFDRPDLQDYPGRLIPVCEEARRDLWRARQNEAVGDSDAIDGQKLYARVKLAYALAVLNGHTDSVREEDWRLSGIVVEVSDATRAKAQRAMSDRERKADRRAGERSGLRKAEEASVTDRLGRQVEVLRRKLQRCPEGVSRRDLRKSMDSRWQRDYFEPALTQLMDSGEVVDAGETYRLLGETLGETK